MGIVKSLVRPVLEPFFRLTRLDLRAARWRLDALQSCHSELSAISFLADSPGAASERLIDLIAPVANRAKQARLSGLARRGAPDFVHLWPGEHYRLLAALVEELKPEKVVDIGTFTGLSALAMLSALPSSAIVITVDVIPWHEILGTFLAESDFADGKLSQLVCDLGRPENAIKHADLLRDADLLLVDGPKDGVFERRLLENFVRIGLKSRAMLVFDDVRLWNMLEIWRMITCPKLDFTSLGHWSGTGLVEWKGPDSS